MLLLPVSLPIGVTWMLPDNCYCVLSVSLSDVLPRCYLFVTWFLCVGLIRSQRALSLRVYNKQHSRDNSKIIQQMAYIGNI